jgi:hypothetical protein
MKTPLIRAATVAATVAVGLGAVATAATAAVPAFDRCPRTDPTITGCIAVTSSDGSIAANNHRLSLAGADINIQGGVNEDGGFVPPTSVPTLTAKPVTVPGGLFGHDLPYNLNRVRATIEAVGPVGYNYFTYTVTAPVRLHFTNSLLGPNCAIGSAASPITLTLTAGTTSPAPPNAPISGSAGTLSTPPGTYFALEGQVQVDNTFAVPAATGCGIVAQSAVTKAINQNLGLPSAAGHYNDAELTLNHYVAP